MSQGDAEPPRSGLVYSDTRMRTDGRNDYGLGAGEEVLAEVPANLKRGFEASGGFLTVTSERLIFEAHSAKINRQPAEIALGSIAGSRKRDNGTGVRTSKSPAAEQVTRAKGEVRGRVR